MAEPAQAYALVAHLLMRAQTAGGLRRPGPICEDPEPLRRGGAFAADTTAAIASYTGFFVKR